MNGILNCGASILSPVVLITAGHCVIENAEYTILSGSAIKSEGIRHKIIEKIFHPNLNTISYVNDLALLKIRPPIDFIYSHNRRIELFDGNVPLNTFGTLSGWGCTHVIER